MFYDERIHAESGKIYKRGILYAVLVSVFYALLRAVSTEFTARNYMTEFFVSVCGIGILLVGLVRFYGASDERTESEKHTYYFHAGKLMIIAALSGYALTIPFDRGNGDYPANHFVIILEMLGYMYFFYSFKSREINFNYTFIAEDKKTYYGRVFENIGKLAAVLLLPFVIAAFLDFAVNGSFLRFWSVLTGYLFSVLGLGIEYLFVSWVEKLSYEDESKRILKKGAIVAYVVWFVFILASEGLELWKVYVTEHMGEFQDTTQSFGEYLSALSYRQMYLSYALNALSAVVLCHVMAAVLDVKAAKKSVRAYLILEVISVAWSLISNVFHLFLDMLEPKQINTFLSVITFINFVFFLLCALSLAMGAHALGKEKKMPKLIVFLPFLPLLCDILARSVSEYQHEWLMPCVIIAALLNIFGCVLAFVFFKKRDAMYFDD